MVASLLAGRPVLPLQFLRSLSTRLSIQEAQFRLLDQTMFAIPLHCTGIVANGNTEQAAFVACIWGSRIAMNRCTLQEYRKKIVTLAPANVFSAR
jgi:hypothetical protein